MLILYFIGDSASFSVENFHNTHKKVLNMHKLEISFFFFNITELSFHVIDIFIHMLLQSLNFQFCHKQFEKVAEL